MSWLRRLVNTFRTGRLRRDIDREQAFHLAERADDLRAAGLSDDEARRRARIQFGSPAAAIERTRDVDIVAAADAAWRNLRYALRALRRTPGFTVTVVLTLTLGIGANSAVFSAIDAVLIRPLPFPNSHELIRLRQTHPTTGDTLVAGARLLDWRRASTLTAVSGYVTEDVSDTTGDIPQHVNRATVLPDFFTVWGIEPAIGRGFNEAEHRLGGPGAVVISHRYWTTRLGRDPGVLSKTVRIAERSYQVVGVMPPRFAFLERDTDWWVPEHIDAPWSQARQFRSSIGLARLRPGVTIDRARADLEGIQAELSRQFPQTDTDLRPVVEPLKETLVGASRGSLWVLFGAVSILLLIACTNIGALLLSRGAQRAQEIALRYSLGATRRAVTWQLLTEAAVLALVGGVAGLGAGAAAAAALRRLAPDVPRLNEAGLDGRILLYTSACVIVVAVTCGLVPALRSSRGHGLPRASTARMSGRHRLQWLLAGVQVSLAVTLLAGAGLLLRSATMLGRVDPGFEPARVLTFRISGSFGEELIYDRTVQRINRTLDALAALPGVRASASTVSLPGVGEFLNEFTIVEGGVTAMADNRVVSPSYFDTMQMPLVAGELCRRPPDARGTSEVIVNQAFALRYLPGRSAVGLHLAASMPDRIVGIVADAREQGLDRPPGPAVYSCFSAPTPFPFFLVRTDGAPASLAGAVRAKVLELEPLRSVYDVVPLVDEIAGVRADERLRTTVLTTFAVSALLLACLGVYGTLSYITRLQRREVGVRLALGASRSGILGHFVGQGLRVAGIASLGGLALSFGLTRALAGMLYGVTPLDPVTLSTAVGIVLVVAALAALVPATRAALFQPMRILREE